MDGRLFKPNATQYLPLCRHYSVAHFAFLDGEVRIGAEPTRVVLGWALGCLDDGQREVLGVWCSAENRSLPFEQAFDELQSRGVETIAVVVCSEPPMVPRRAANPMVDGETDSQIWQSRQTFPCRIGRTRAGLSRELRAFDDLPARLKRLAKAGESVVRHLQRRAERAVRQHGAFADAQTAELFLAVKLRMETVSQREELKIGRSSVPEQGRRCSYGPAHG